jgi:hypothetical protein
VPVGEAIYAVDVFPDKRLEDCELLDGCLPFLLRDGHEIRYGSSALVNRIIGSASATGIRSSFRLPTSRAMTVSNPVQSTTTKSRLRHRMVLPGVKLTATAITFSLVLERNARYC